MKLMPQEVEVRYVLPALRKQFTIALAKKGLKQKEIAEKLNITPAAVSQYLSKKRGTTNFPKKIQKEIDNSTKQIVENVSTAYEEINRISNDIRKTATICDIHRMYDDVPKNCGVCFSK
jgi:hypothetical protein